MEWLCGLGERRAGTDAERRAANGLAERLRAAGRRVEIEPTYVHPQWPAVHFLHCLVAIAGSLIAPVQPAVGFSLVLAAAVSLYLDLSGRAYLARRLFFRRASQNVVSPPLDERETDRVLICAHYDAPLTGAAYNDWALAAFERFRRLWPARTSPQAVIFWAIALLLPPLGARMAGLDDSWLSLLQLPQTLILIVAAFMLGEIGLSPPGPGANDNAAGVDAALRAAEALGSNPPEKLEVHLLLCGAGESTRQGARQFIRSHRRGLPKERTWVIDIDSPGRGDPRFVELEVPVLAQAADPTLLELCAALADGDPARAPLPLGPASTASLAGAFGYPAIALTARDGVEFVPAEHHTPADLPPQVSEAGVAAVAELATELVRLLDRDLGRSPRTAA